MRGYSGAIGSFTLTIISASAQTSSADSIIVAPARWYKESSNPDPSPASFSTSTRWPASVSARTPAGVSPTRYSLSLISFGSPMITVFCSNCFGLEVAFGDLVNERLEILWPAGARNLRRAQDRIGGFRVRFDLQTATDGEPGGSSSGDLSIGANQGNKHQTRAQLYRVNLCIAGLVVQNRAQSYSDCLRTRYLHLCRRARDVRILLMYLLPHR